LTGITVSSTATTVKPGGSAQINIKAVGSITPETDGIEVSPSSAVFTVSALDKSGTDPAAYPLSGRTYVDNTGLLRVGDDVKIGVELTIHAISTYVNPSGETQTNDGEVVITVG